MCYYKVIVSVSRKKDKIIYFILFKYILFLETLLELGYLLVNIITNYVITIIIPHDDFLLTGHKILLTLY